MNKRNPTYTHYSNGVMTAKNADGETVAEFRPHFDGQYPIVLINEEIKRWTNLHEIDAYLPWFAYFKQDVQATFIQVSEKLHKRLQKEGKGTDIKDFLTEKGFCTSEIKMPYDFCGYIQSLPSVQQLAKELR